MSVTNEQFESNIVLATINAKWIHPSIALRLLKSNLGNLENRCRILEFALRQMEPEIIDLILASKPWILGLSVSIWNHRVTLNLLRALFEKWKNSLRPWVILGGPEVSHLPIYAEIFNYSDYVIKGEGEAAFRELCEKLLKLKIMAAGSGKLEREFLDANSDKPNNPKFISASLPDISRIVSPYDLYDDEDLNRPLLYVESSRGCFYNCDFCLSSLDKKVREIPLDKFFAHMDKLLRRRSSSQFRNRRWTIKFLDRSFNINSMRAREILLFFLNWIEKINLYPLCVHFEMVPFNFPPELREILRRFPPGSLRLELGIQTLNPEIISLINRAGTTEEAMEVIAFLREETNAIVHADLIAGLPGEDMYSFGKGFDCLWKIMTAAKHKELPESRLMEIQVGILKLLPGAPMARHTITHGMVYSSEPPYEVIETADIPKPEMDRIKNFARFWEILVNRNKFKDQISRFLPQGEPVFMRFIELSDCLYKHFGRNWGIDREELLKVLEKANIND